MITLIAFLIIKGVLAQVEAQPLIFGLLGIVVALAYRRKIRSDDGSQIGRMQAT
ncbi:MAG: hypothetical protein U5J78_03305 [Parasphingorhabdus sp.]|nr:hypothetical protein [Parasphingorhabdus sp.]